MDLRDCRAIRLYHPVAPCTAKTRSSATEKNLPLGKKLRSRPIRLLFLIDLIRSATRLG